MNLQPGRPTLREVGTLSTVVSSSLTLFDEQSMAPYLAARWAGAALGNLVDRVFFTWTATSIGRPSLSSMVSSYFHHYVLVFLILSFSDCNGVILLMIDLGGKGNVQVSITCLHYRLLINFDVQQLVAMNSTRR